MSQEVAFTLPHTTHVSTVEVPPSEELSVREQEILAGIQELQRQLIAVREKDEDDGPATNTTGDDDESTKSKDTLIMVSNRLPVTVSRSDSGDYEFRMSSGGLVTALQGVRDQLQFLWIGWLGQEVPEEEQDRVRASLLAEHNCLPVFMPESLANLFYSGFCNGVLWPLFHYVPLPMYKGGSDKKFDPRLWEAYREANDLFADVVGDVYNDGDLVFIHDYHLMRLPAALRTRHPNCKIGWFLHTPFPSSEMYRILPVRRPLLEGLLCADLIGFHTYDYARHFLSSCSRVLAVDCSPKGVEHRGRFAALGVFPIGIDPDHFTHLVNTPGCQNRIEELRQRHAGKRILLGVDRLDYIKGMPHKLLALEMFLTRYPEWTDKVTLIQIAVPSRTDVAEYQDLSRRVNELVGRINGQFGTLEHNPIYYINQSISQEELCAIYAVADVCLVTSVRDGMNLVSHEYVVVQGCLKGEVELAPEDMAPVDPNSPDDTGPGVLVLSEFAGSAQSLSGAIRVNPWNTEELAAAINQALTMSSVERELRHQKLYRYVTTHTASFWAKSFIEDFKAACDSPAHASKLPPLPTDQILEAYANSKNRLIISDYDGTLTALQSLPQLAAPSPFVKNVLDSLSRDDKNTVFIVSGRERRYLEKWLGQLKVGLAAEYGFFFRMHDQTDWTTVAAAAGFDNSWKDIVRPIMKYFTERTPGSYIEDKESSLTWHYRDADPHFGAWQAKDLQINMDDVLSSLPLEVLQGTKIVEVRHQLANKGMVLEKILQYLQEPGVVDADVAAATNEATEPPAMPPTSPDSTSPATSAEPVTGSSVAVGTGAYAAATSARQSATTPAAEGAEIDFIFCVGDDRSDEDMFVALKQLVELSALDVANEVSNVETQSEQQQQQGQSQQPSHQQAAAEAPGTEHKSADGQDEDEDTGAGSEDDAVPSHGGDSWSVPGRPRISPDCKVFACRLGNDSSQASYSLASLAELRRVLREFASVSRTSTR